MERRRTGQGQRDSFHKDNRYRSRTDNNSRNNKGRKNSNSEYSRNSYSKRKENSTTEGSKKFENPKFFYKRVHGNYSKLYIPEAYEKTKRNEKKTSPKSDQETHSPLEFQDVSSNDENQNDTNQLPHLAARKNSKTDMKANEANVSNIPFIIIIIIIIIMIIIFFISFFIMIYFKIMYFKFKFIIHNNKYT